MKINFFLNVVKLIFIETVINLNFFEAVDKLSFVEDAVRSSVENVNQRKKKTAVQNGTPLQIFQIYVSTNGSVCYFSNRRNWFKAVFTYFISFP